MHEFIVWVRPKGGLEFQVCVKVDKDCVDTARQQALRLVDEDLACQHEATAVYSSGVFPPVLLWTAACN